MVGLAQVQSRFLEDEVYASKAAFVKEVNLGRVSDAVQDDSGLYKGRHRGE